MSNAAAIRENLDMVEEAYEFMLAYAAQGRVEEGAGPDGAHIRTFVERFLAAADALAPDIDALIGSDPTGGAGFLDSFRRDSDAVRAVLRLLLGRPSISSEMIDNTNGLIVMRSYLTSLFFIDKVLAPPAR